jgi:hypothetical protein
MQLFSMQLAWGCETRTTADERQMLRGTFRVFKVTFGSLLPDVEQRDTR